MLTEIAFHNNLIRNNNNNNNNKEFISIKHNQLQRGKSVDYP